MLVAVTLIAAVVPVVSAMGEVSHDPATLTVELDQSWIYGQFSPDSKYWVDLINNDDTEGDELYAVPLDGSEPPHRLSPELGTPEDHVSWFEITPDGATVVFAQGQHYDRRERLRSGSCMRSPLKVDQLPRSRRTSTSATCCGSRI